MGDGLWFMESPIIEGVKTERRKQSSDCSSVSPERPMTRVRRLGFCGQIFIAVSMLSTLVSAGSSCGNPNRSALAYLIPL